MGLPNEAKGGPSRWLADVGVDDIVASTKKVKELGGMLSVEVTPVADMGSMSVIVDPSGAPLGRWR